MSHSKLIFSLLFASLFFLTSCGGSSGGDDTDTGDTDTGDTDTGDTDSGVDTETAGYFDSTLFSSDLTSETRVSCTLENGSTTTCYEITFVANGAGTTEGTGTIGPFCPEYETDPRDETGVGVYDGDTNPGFQSLIDAVQNMEADGFDIINDDGSINTQGGGSGSACLEMPMDTSLEVTYLIPVTPEVRSEPYEISTIESIGFGVTGVPYKGHPPGVAVAEAGVGGSGSGNIPSLDLCGGHVDPAGYYHWHFVPQSMNQVMESDSYDYTDLYGMTCSNSNIASSEPAAFAGLAKDGYPIYGAYDSVSGVDTDPDEVVTVDECNGHSHETDEYPDGVYHYHAIAGGAPNVPQCLMGSFVNGGDFSYQ